MKALIDCNDLTYELPLFGSNVVIRVSNSYEEFTTPIIMKVYEEALRLQKIFNFYDKDSELSKLNMKRELVVSKEMLEVVSMALDYCKLTNGKYDISKGKNFLERKNGKQIIDYDCTYKDVILDKNTQKIILMNKDVMIDLGSIAKGYIVDKIILALKEQGLDQAVVDGRGDIRVLGDEAEQIIVQHPRISESNSIVEIRLTNESIATSGDYMQYSSTYENNHIINNNFASVSVIAKNLCEADVIATVISTSGKEIINKLQLTNPILIIDRDMNTQMFNNFEKYVVDDNNFYKHDNDKGII